MFGAGKEQWWEKVRSGDMTHKNSHCALGGSRNVLPWPEESPAIWGGPVTTLSGVCFAVCMGEYDLYARACSEIISSILYTNLKWWVPGRYWDNAKMKRLVSLAQGHLTRSGLRRKYWWNLSLNFSSWELCSASGYVLCSLAWPSHWWVRAAPRSFLLHFS